jgi:hypothetical protein
VIAANLSFFLPKSSVFRPALARPTNASDLCHALVQSTEPDGAAKLPKLRAGGLTSNRNDSLDHLFRLSCTI